MFKVRFFKTEEEAKVFQSNQKRSVLYKNTPRSRSKKDHIMMANALGYDPEDYKYSVNWRV